MAIVLILVSVLARWSWIHNRTFRITHLIAIGVVVLQAWLGVLVVLVWFLGKRSRR